MQCNADDNLTVAGSLQSCLEWEQRMFHIFSRGGWLYKPSKRSGEPSQVCRYLGLIVDSRYKTGCNVVFSVFRDLTFSIPADKVTGIVALCRQLLGQRNVRVKELAKLAGMLQAVRLATGPIVAIMTRSMYVTVDRAANWGSRVKLDPLSRVELEWWVANLHKVDRFPIPNSHSTTVFDYSVASDASGVGHYVYSVGPGRCTLASRAFSREEQGESSTWREVRGLESVFVV